jgi:uncharacterized protein YqgC (DUF456 family)
MLDDWTDSELGARADTALKSIGKIIAITIGLPTAIIIACIPPFIGTYIGEVMIAGQTMGNETITFPGLFGLLAGICFWFAVVLVLDDV